MLRYLNERINFGAQRTRCDVGGSGGENGEGKPRRHTASTVIIIISRTGGTRSARCGQLTAATANGSRRRATVSGLGRPSRRRECVTHVPRRPRPKVHFARS